MKLPKHLFRLLITLAIVLLVHPYSARAAACKRYHVVQTGEDIGGISQMYGVSWASVIELNQLAYPGIIYVGQSLCLETEETITEQTSSEGFRFSSVRVTRNDSVIISTKNIPANDLFHVYMGPNGSKGADGIWVGDLYTGPGGSVSATFPIPTPLYGSTKIAMRMESDQSGVYYYSWFYNINGSGLAASGSTSSSSKYVSFSIVRVNPGNWVTIKVKNAHPNERYYVVIGKMGTKAANGAVVGTFNAGSDGTISATFPIPNKFSDNKRLAIRIESDSSGSYYYNWFEND